MAGLFYGWAKIMDILHEEDGVIDEAPQHKFFTQIPNSVLTWPGINHTAFRLYFWYKMICGESSRPCFHSLETISAHLSMHQNTIIASRKLLVKIGLITVTESRAPSGNKRNLVRCLDIWKQNLAWTYPSVDNKPLQNKQEVNECLALQNKQEATTKLAGGHYKTSRRLICNELYESIKKELSGEPDVSLFQDEGFKINGEDTPAKETYASSFAKRLYACLAEHRKIFAKVNLEKWTETIRIFLVNSELSREDLDPVLDWYSKNINGEFSPQAYSADAFVKKFVQIKRQMDIANQSISSAKNGAMSVYEKNQQSVDIVLERLRAKNGSK